LTTVLGLPYDDGTTANWGVLMQRRDFLASGAAASAVAALPPAAALAQTAMTPAPDQIGPDDWNLRSEKVTRNRKTALVLSGGIAQGVYESGVVKSLLKRGYTFDVICGTSIGALNGALIAQGDHEMLEHIWANLGKTPIKKYERHAKLVSDALTAFNKDGSALLNRYVVPLFQLNQAYDDGAIAKLLGVYDPSGAQSVLRPLDLSKVQTPFMCAVTNVNVGRAEAIFANVPDRPTPQFDTRTNVPVNPLSYKNPDHVAMYPEAVRASGALPFALPPVPLRGLNANSTKDKPQYFADGGVANNTPVRLARKLGVTDMICVFMSPRSITTPGKPPETLVDAFLNLYTANQNQLLDDEILLAMETRDKLGLNDQTYALLAALPRLSDRLINIYEVRPSSDILVQALDFDRQDFLDYGFLRGEIDGNENPTLYPRPPDTFVPL
jgi:predicted acylesterase/phospholipase RssA